MYAYVQMKFVRKYERFIFPVSLCFRCLNVLFCQTFFVPDEYWQSLEVAHRSAFGYGHLTWEWDKGIRSSMYPAVFSLLFKGLHFLHVDTPELVVWSPTLLQAVFAAVCDLFVYKLAFQVWNSRIFALTAILMHMTSWFSLYCMTRTLSNTMETVVTTAGLYFFLKAMATGRYSHTALCLSGLACLVRPTALFMWLPLIAGRVAVSSNKMKVVVTELIPVGSLLMASSLLIDRIFYGKWIFVHYNFLHFNVLEGVANFYGTHPWHWYISQGVPVVLLSWLPMLLFSVWTILFKLADKMKHAAKHKKYLAVFKKTLIYNHQLQILLLIFIEILAHSLLPHKEFRFILPILPLTVCLTAPSVYNLWKSRNRIKVLFCVSLFLVNLLAAGYFLLLHQRGTLDSVKYLRQAVEQNEAEDLSVHFLLPCHHAPFYSHIHRNISMEFLQCQPNIDDTYINEDEHFHASPSDWLARKYSNFEKDPPTYIILYDVTLPRIDDFIKRYKFVKVAEHFHTHFPDGPNIGRYVVTLRRSQDMDV